MGDMRSAKWGRRLVVLGSLLLLAAGAVIAGYVLHLPVPGFVHAKAEAPAAPKAERPKVQLVKDKNAPPHSIIVPEEVRRSLQIRKHNEDQLATVIQPIFKRPLHLSGSTMLDINNIHRIKCRFAPAEVVRIENRTYRPGEGTKEPRPWQVGDFVEKGNPLAVLYSVDVGAKKNDLIDALVSFKYDNEIYQRAKTSAALPEVVKEGFRKAVQSDENAMKRALKNLQLWDIPKEDIDAVYKEAEEIIKNDGKRRPEAEKLDPDNLDPWGKVVIKAPFDGYIVEQNVAAKEMVVDQTVILYQIASTDSLLVTAYCPEEQVKELFNLKEKLYKFNQVEMTWSLQPLGQTDTDPPVKGTIDEIGQLVDPNSHTVPLRGRITNKTKLRAGQYVTATIELPAPEKVVEVPANAVADDGKQAIVFVQTDAKKGQYTMRRVDITHRFDHRVFVRSELDDKDRSITTEEAEQGLLPKEALKIGDKVLVSGLLGLKKELEDLESEEQN